MRSMTAVLGVALVATAALSLGAARGDDVNGAPNPYRVVDNWPQLPQGRVWGMAIAHIGVLASVAALVLGSKP